MSVNKFIQVDEASPAKVKNFYVIILDESGSMGSVTEATRVGVNEQLQTIRGLSKDYPEQEYYVSLVTFSYKRRKLFWNELASGEDTKVVDLAEGSYKPNGGTLLYDTVHATVVEFQEEAATDLAEPANKVNVLIFTDGQDTSSAKYDGGDIKKLVDSLQAGKQWSFSYVGCDHDVFSAARSLGISKNNTMQFSGGANKLAGTKSAFATMSQSLSNYSALRSTAIKSGVVGTDKENDYSVSYFQGPKQPLKWEAEKNLDGLIQGAVESAVLKAKADVQGDQSQKG